MIIPSANEKPQYEDKYFQGIFDYFSENNK